MEESEISVPKDTKFEIKIPAISSYDGGLLLPPTTVQRKMPQTTETATNKLPQNFQKHRKMLQDTTKKIKKFNHFKVWCFNIHAKKD